MKRARRLAVWVQRHARPLVVASVVMLAWAAWLASDLRIDGRMRQLLPSHYPAVAGIDEATRRLGNQSDLYIVVRSPDVEANRRFGSQVVAALQGHPDLRWVECERDWSFFERHVLLYASLPELLQLRRDVIVRIRREIGARVYGEFGEPDDDDDDAPSEADTWLDRYRGRAPPRFREADGGRLLVVTARPSATATDVTFAKRLVADVDARVQALSPAEVHPDMTVAIEGPFVGHGRRVQQLSDEVAAGSGVAVFGVLTCLVVFFRSARAVAFVLGAVVFASVVALAFAAVVYGRLNLITAFIFAILAGLGIDAGIHFLARFRDELSRRADPTEALAATYATTARPTLAAGAGTGLAFASLCAADFEGFSQFGAVAAVGMGLSLLATLVLMPAWIVVAHRWRPWRPRPRTPIPERGSARRSSSRMRSALMLLVAVGAIGAGVALSPRLAFEYDFDALGHPPRASTVDEIDYKDAIGREESLAPAVVFSDDPGQIARVYRQLAVLDAMTPDQARAGATIGADRLDGWRRGPPAPTYADAPDEDFGDEDFGDDDLDDPRFVALAARAARAYPRPETAATLAKYEPSRRATMARRLAKVSAVQAFVPDDQADKLAIIADIRRRVDDKEPHLSAATRRELDRWRDALAVTTPIAIEDLPPWVRAPFTDASRHVGRFLVFRTHGAKADVRNATEIYEAFAELEDPAGPVRTSASFYVIPEVFAAVGHDGPRVLLVAFVAMLLTSAWTLRSLGGALAVTLVLAVTFGALVAIMVWTDQRLSVFNLIVFPLLLGMGQDDALHVYARWREGGRGVVDLGETTAAVFVTSATTICGFAGILMSDHRGLGALATTAIIGLVLAWLAAVFVLPAALECVGARARSPR